MDLMILSPDSDALPADAERGPKPGSQWTMTPICSSMIGTQRQFVATMNNNAREVPFIDLLLGKKEASTAGKSEAKPVEDEHDSAVAGPATNSLNASQVKIVRSFLSAAPGTIILTQGPPGCGKSTLLVALIRQYLWSKSDGRRRIMVCAPTNKAITVVASRFFEMISQEEEESCSVIITGDENKLLEGRKKTSHLRRYYFWQWLNVVGEEYDRIITFCHPDKPSDDSLDVMLYVARRMQRRLEKSLPDLPPQLTAAANKVISQLTKLQTSDGGAKLSILRTVREVKRYLLRLEQDVVRRQLMNTADVIFCTLCSAGSPYVQQGNPIDDLVVDEAAAATEPDLYIPFALQPKRLLVIGDPKQLPATVVSERAKSFGLNVSLHERLMYGCKYDYILLREQYRMKPAISSFPSRTFYGSQLADGPNVSQPTYGAAANKFGNGSPYLFYQVDGVATLSNSGSLENFKEAEAVVQVIAALRATGRGRWHDLERLRIITFYQAQVALIAKLLKRRGLDKVLVATVDSSQGCEADVVVVSFVRGQGTAGFLADDRRLNVALTRARHQLICIGNAAAMRHIEFGPTLQKMVVDANERRVVVRQLPTQCNAAALHNLLK